MNDTDKQRIIDIIRMAKKLGWLHLDVHDRTGSLMNLADVEKCMLAMTDANYFKRMMQWSGEYLTKTQNGSTKE